MKKIQDTPLYEILPASIKDDAIIKASAKALDPLLQKTIDATTNLLILSRLDRSEQATKNLLEPFIRLAEDRNGLKELTFEELEELAWQMHVDFREVAKTKEELAKMVLDSIAWHRIKGTPRSLINALELFGYEVAIEEDGKDDYWATYQLGINGVKSFDELSHILSIADEVAPVRCKLFRVYNEEYDFRPGVWSECKWSECFWSNYSGIHFTDVPGYESEEDLIISFGDNHKVQSEQYSKQKNGVFIYENTHGFLCPYIDGILWSYHSWGEAGITNHGFIVSELYSTHFADRIRISDTWQGLWDSRKWYIVDTWDRVLDEWQIFIQSQYKSQAVYSENGLWGDINANYSIPMASVIDEGPLWSNDIWDSNKTRIQEIEIKEQKLSNLSLITEKICPDSSFAFITSSLLNGELIHIKEKTSFSHSARQPILCAEALYEDKKWQGAWNKEPWAELYGYGRKETATAFSIRSEVL